MRAIEQYAFAVYALCYPKVPLILTSVFNTKEELLARIVENIPRCVAVVEAGHLQHPSEHIHFLFIRKDVCSAYHIAVCRFGREKANLLPPVNGGKVLDKDIDGSGILTSSVRCLRVNGSMQVAVRCLKRDIFVVLSHWYRLRHIWFVCTFCLHLLRHRCRTYPFRMAGLHHFLSQTGVL